MAPSSSSSGLFFKTLWGEWSIVYMAFILVGVALLLLDPRLRRFSSPAMIISLLSLGLAVRMAWMLAQISLATSSYALRTLDRSALLMQFIAVSILVAGWAEAVFLTTKIRRMMKISFVAINVILIAFTIATGFTSEGSTIYYVNLCVLAASSFLLVLLTQIFGGLVLARFDGGSLNVFSFSSTTGFGAIKRRTAIALSKIAICSTVMSVCFLGRFVGYVLYINASCDDLDDDDWTCSKLLRYFAVQIPDLVPFLTVLLALTSVGSLGRVVAKCCVVLADHDGTAADGDKQQGRMEEQRKSATEAAPLLLRAVQEDASSWRSGGSLTFPGDDDMEEDGGTPAPSDVVYEEEVGHYFDDEEEEEEERVGWGFGSDLQDAVA